MKNVFKSIFVLAMMLTASKSYSEARLGIKGGLNILFLGTEMRNTKLGGHIGGTAEFKLNDNFSIEPGLFFSSKGGNYPVYKYSYGSGYNTESSVSIYYLEIPLNLLLKADAEHFQIIFNAGPYCANALMANRVSDGYSSKIEIGSNGVSTFDFGLNAGIAIGIKHFIIGTQYGYGLIENGLGYNNRVLGLSVGYKFGD